MLFIPCPTPSQRGLVTSQPQSLIPHLDGPKWWRILHPILQHQILQTLMHSTDIPVPRSNRNNPGVTNEKFDISSISIPSNQHRGCEPCLYCLCTPYTVHQGQCCTALATLWSSVRATAFSQPCCNPYLPLQQMPHPHQSVQPAACHPTHRPSSIFR